MSLVEQLDIDFKQALKARESEKVSVFRLVRSSIKNLEISKQGVASDEDVVEILQREIKQHKESIEANIKAERSEEVERLEQEVVLLLKYLPAQLSSEELAGIIKSVIAEKNATSMADLGRVMGGVMPNVHGRASGDVVGKMVREILSS
ncbi:glutamyl-tRNA amidotransferase [bacterium CG10_46_32]|nr:MAG: glutamyl-tRNA amidotransferase [bacterium CG10_46_32]PIR56451.1 MAG: glutamyl-tRNA amidotransferase [Parcubacteria group bacterium CG10_big_fil_rev_8_21_14_0_10_46_32]